MLFLLFIPIVSACPNLSPNVLYPAKNIGKLQCTGTCSPLQNISCIGIRVDNPCYIWECNNIPEYMESRVTIQVPPPYDTIVIETEPVELTTLLALLCTTVVFFCVSPAFFMGSLLAQDGYDVTIRFTS